MRCRVAYRIAQRPGRLTRQSVGVLSLDDSGLRIDGPAPLRAAFSEIQWLSVTDRVGLFHIGIGSSPPVFVTPVLWSLGGFVQFVRPPLNEALYAELRRRVEGLWHSADSGCDIRLPALPFRQDAAGDPGTGRFPGRLRALLGGVLAPLLALYVASYYHLSRRGMQQARACNMRGFLYAPLEEVSRTRDLSRHEARAWLFAPLNQMDQAVFRAQGPVRSIFWGLSKESGQAAPGAETSHLEPEQGPGQAEPRAPADGGRGPGC